VRWGGRGVDGFVKRGARVANWHLDCVYTGYI
jgi:hypothetical protein